MSEEVRHFKMALKLACPVMKFSCPEPRLSIEIAYYSPKWICKNSKIRKADGMNLDKAVYDAISEKIGIDDSHFFKWAGIKVLSQEEYTEIQVTEIESES
jgi:Holliday junction resolvase RusA-like endonuclease